jgi:hypothetical protein
MNDNYGHRGTVYSPPTTSAVKIFALALFSAALLLLSGCSNDKGTTPYSNVITLSVTSPHDGDTVSQEVTVTATVKGGTPSQISFFVDQGSSPLGVATSSPYSIKWALFLYPDSSEHRIWAAARFESGQDIISDTITVLVDNSWDRPAAVTLYEPIAVTPHTVTLKWQRSTASDFESYRVYYSETPGVTEQSVYVASIGSRSTDTMTIDHGSENVTRYYRVFVHDSFGLISGSNEIAAATTNLIPTPVQLSVSPDLTDGSLNLAWSKSDITDFDHYEVRRSTASSVSRSDELLYTGISEIDTSFADVSIDRLSPYHYRVYIVDTGDLSAGSNEVSEELPSLAGLAGQWSFEEESGLTCYDESGNNDHVTLQRGPVRIPGVSGNAIQMDGQYSFASFPPLYFSSPSALTVSIWVELSDDTSGCVIYHGANGEWAVYVTGGNIWSFRVRLSNAIWYHLDVPIASHEGWHHLAMVWQQSVGLSGYVDGELAASIDLPSLALHNPSDRYLPTIGAAGCSVCGRQDFLACAVDEARVYTRVLSADEIKLLFRL